VKFTNRFAVIATVALSLVMSPAAFAQSAATELSSNIENLQDVYANLKVGDEQIASTEAELAATKAKLEGLLETRFLNIQEAYRLGDQIQIGIDQLIEGYSQAPEALPTNIEEPIVPTPVEPTPEQPAVDPTPVEPAPAPEEAIIEPTPEEAAPVEVVEPAAPAEVTPVELTEPEAAEEIAPEAEQGAIEEAAEEVVVENFEETGTTASSAKKSGCWVFAPFHWVYARLT
jgi:hypothetical protein